MEKPKKHGEIRMATTQQIQEYIAGVRKVAFDRGLTEEDITQRIDILFNGSGEICDYIRKKGNKNNSYAKNNVSLVGFDKFFDF